MRYWYYSTQVKLSYWWLSFRTRHKLSWYHFRHWFFRWVQDNDGDIGLQIAGIITLIKYKDSTICYFGRKGYMEAEKFQGKGERA